SPAGGGACRSCSPTRSRDGGPIQHVHALPCSARFTAQHYLIGADFGPENQPHSHAYRVEFAPGRRPPGRPRLPGGHRRRCRRALDEVLAGVRDRP
ncbi:MAG: hypothetical protein MZV70_08580, partial [Desulfobacterales bacterium]|nr:hypothetical protein [Desulfobacterales bacterium]